MLGPWHVIDNGMQSIAEDNCQVPDAEQAMVACPIQKLETNSAVPVGTAGAGKAAHTKYHLSHNVISCFCSDLGLTYAQHSQPLMRCT